MCNLCINTYTPRVVYGDAASACVHAQTKGATGLFSRRVISMYNHSHCLGHGSRWLKRKGGRGPRSFSLAECSTDSTYPGSVTSLTTSHSSRHVDKLDRELPLEIHMRTCVRKRAWR